jgi:hypothetical protein
MIRGLPYSLTAGYHGIDWHPRQRNHLRLKKNPWFALEVLSPLRQPVKAPLQN